MALDFSTARYLGPLSDAEPEGAATPRPPLDFSRAKRIGDVPESSSFLRRAVGDTALSVGQGVVGLGESVVGALDIPTMGYAGKVLKDYAGYDPGATTRFLEEQKTPEQQQANRAVAEAKGFGGTLSALAQNPSVIPQKVAETIPLIAGGGALARALPAALSPLARGAFGEGALQAGSSAEQSRQASPTGTITPTQAALALTSGAVTGLITRGAGRVANELGIGDIEQLVAGGQITAAQGKGLARRAAEGALTEGVLEEAPQSAQEQALQNIAMGRPVGEGVPEATAIGGTLGSVIGAGAGALPQGVLPAAVPPGVVPPPVVPPPGPVAPDWGTTTGVFPQGQPVAPGAPSPLSPDFETAPGAAGGLSASNAGQSIPAAPGAPSWGTAPGAALTTTPAEDISGAYRDQEIAALLQESEAQKVRARDFGPALAQQREQQGEVAQARGRAEGVGEPSPKTAMQAAFELAQEKVNERQTKTQGQAARPTADEAATTLQADAAEGRPPTDARVAAAVRSEQARVDAAAGRGVLGRAGAVEGAKPADAGGGAEPIGGEKGRGPAEGGAGVRVEDQGGEGIAGAGQAQVAAIDQAAHEAATSPRNDLPEPTEAQIEAGNWKKGHVRLQGMDISIEHPRGSVRRGVDKGGKPWAVTMSAAYGYIKGTVGKDKGQIDTYIGEHPETERTFVVDQIDPKTGRFDEHKVMLGYTSQAAAESAYDAAFSDGSGPTRRKAVSEVSVDAFKAWLASGNTKEPFEGAKLGKLETPPATGTAKGEIAPPAPSPEAALPQKERRTQVTRRMRISEMSPEEMRRELLVDAVTGLGNKRAYTESKKLPVQVSIDLDSLKWVNDNLGHDSGDVMLRAFGEALAAETPHGYHLSGDEFVMQGASEAVARAVLVRVGERMAGARVEVTLPDGTVISKTGIGFSYGLGGSYEDADTALRGHKDERERAGQRPGRGQEPAGVERKPATVAGEASQGEEGHPREGAAGDEGGVAAEERRGAIGGEKAAPQKEVKEEGGTTLAEEYKAKPPVKHFDERLDDPGTQTTLGAMAANSGWRQRGGELLRDADHKVTGRTTWIPREPWFAELPERLNEAATVAAVKKAIAGDKLGAKERRVVGFMLDAMDRGREEGAVVADEEADAERAAIVAEAEAALSALSDDDINTLLSYDTLSETELEQFFASEPPTSDLGTEEATAQRTEEGDRAGGAEARPAERPLLEAYTETELRQREEARVATERREAEETAARLKKQEADKALADFVLSGSDREADELAARGQQSLFDQPTREVDRRLYALGADSARLRELAFAGKREEFDQAAKEEFKKMKSDLSKSGTEDERRASRAVDIDKLPESFFRSLYKRARRLAVEAGRDPIIYGEAVRKAADERGMIDPGVLAAFMSGWDHALAGKTKSTLSGDIRADGYGAARKWLSTPDGRAYYQGKRAKKLEGTGVELRRHWEQKVRSLDELATNDAEVVIATVEAATKRAELFAPVLSEGATPGVKRYIFALRNELIPFIEWFGREGPAKYAGRRKHAPKVRIRNYITQETQGVQNIEELKGEARNYIDRISGVAQALNGTANITEAAAALKKYVTGSDEPGDFKQRTEEWRALLPHVRHPAKFMAFTSGREVDAMREVEQTPDSDDNATHATPLNRPKLDKIVRTSEHDWRRGKDVTPKQMKDTFGFADVGFGKWVGTQQDQDHLNYAYDAFRDLAEFIGIDPKAIGLGGRLHFTIGALGHGRHSAHYSPNHPHPDGGMVAVINVTNTKGDGSVSHEWMHALDFHLRKGSAEGHRGIQAVKDALIMKWDIANVLKVLPQFFGGDRRFTGSLKKADPVANAQYAMTYYGKGVVTDFYKEAVALGKDYWANDNEPFARAGEAWVHDGLSGRNDYLVSDWVAEGKVKKPPYRGVPYPTGDERSAFGEWYKALFASLEWRADGPHFSPAKWAKNVPAGLAEHRNELDKVRESIPEMYEDWLVQDAVARAAREQDATDEALAKVEAERAQEATAATGTAGPATDAELEQLFDAVVAEKRESLQEKPEAQTPGEVSVPTEAEVDATLAAEAPTFEKPRYLGTDSEGNHIMSAERVDRSQRLEKRAPTRAEAEAKLRKAMEPPPAKAKPPSKKTAAHLVKQAAKLGVTGVGEAMQGLADIFGAGRIQSFPGGFDDEAYAKAKPHFEAALKAFQAAGKTLKELFKMLLDTFGEGIRPYAIRFAKDQNLSTHGNLKGDEPPPIDAPRPGPQPVAAEETTPAAPLPPHSPHITLAADLRDRLLTDDTTPVTAPELFRLANVAYGGTMAEGKYISKDAYDALELGLSEVLLLRATTRVAPTVGARDIAADIKNLDVLQEKLPTPSKRSDEQVSLQQFSTPPTFAKAMAWVANIGKNDIVLEPSAGTGNIVTQALLYQPAEMHANEISGRRAAMLEGLGNYANNYDYPIVTITRENAMHLHGLLPGVTPSVILMNPPFSADLNLPGKKATEVGAKHVEAALKKLAPGGRAVILLGRGMGLTEGGEGRPAFREWWDKIKGEYNVRANIGIAGRAYRKFGTEFETVMVVIDKSGPTKGAILNKQVDALTALPALLENIRNDRGPVQKKPSRPDKRPATQPGGEAVAGAREGETGLGLPVLPATDEPLSPRVPEGSAEGQPQRGPGDGRELDDVLGAAGGDGLPSQKRGGRGGQLVAAGSGGVRGGRRGPAGSRPGAQRGAEDQDGGNLAAIEDTAGHTLVEDGEQQAGEIEAGVTYEKYRPSVTLKGAKPHPTELAESAAMASVRAPKAIYIPQLPKGVVTGGALSDAQLTNIILAGQSHEEVLVGGERRGFFVGDGTGVGKGRQIAGVILDNWNQGRKKAVWISANQKLYADAVRDATGVGFDSSNLIKQSDIKGKIKSKEAILFTSYDTLKEVSNEVKDATGKVIKEAEKRIDQIVEWLGEDFDGVIAFDEAHNMGNAIERKGKRGKIDASAKALAGVDLQKRLPKARVLYVSATGATEVANLAFADRLGLWGEGTSFADKKTFISAIDAGGVAAMEVVAKDMKSMGLYQARSLGFDGIEYRELLHELPEAQGAMYDTIARAWQMVNDNVESVMVDTGQAKNGMAKGRAMAAYWGAQQRFFNQVLTALSAPSLVRDIHAQLDGGNSAVVQLVNTNEAIADRRMAQAAAADIDLAEVDITPRDILMQYVQNSFPVNLYEEYTDDDGNEKWRPVVDAAGEPVKDPAAVVKRDALLEKLATLAVPEGIMEQIINHFGSDAVAEITGRKRRLVRSPDGKVEEQKLSDAKSNVDAAAFMEGKKRILIFSDAGGTGRSYHADLGSKNQQKRIHYLVQPGWIASNAMQGLGRTHRTNQKQPPEYVLVTTNLKAQRRFLSSIARRLDQLGALTKGERKSANQGLFAADMNLENVYSQLALTSLTMEAADAKAPISKAMFLRMGIYAWDQDGNLLIEKIPTVPTLLNRLLSLEQKDMNQVFDAFFERVQANVEYARQTGSLDIGMETLTAQSVVKTHDDVVAKSPGRRGDTRYTVIELTNPVRFTQFDELPLTYHPSFMRNKRSGAIYAVVDAPTITNPETGALIKRKRRIGVSSAQYMKVDEFKSENYEFLDSLSREEHRAEWDKEIAASPQMKTSKVHLVTGALLPVWDRLPQGMSRILRAQTDEGERILGREIAPKDLNATLKRLGADVAAVKVTPTEAVRVVMEDGATVELANGWKISRRLVNQEPRLEIVGPAGADLNILKDQGAFTEIIAYRSRVFIPLENAADVMARITASKPIVEVVDKEGPKYSRGPTSPGEEFSVEPGDDAITAALKLLAQSDDLFQLPRSDAKTLREIAGEVEPGMMVKDFSGRLTSEDQWAGWWEVTMPDGNPADVYQSKDGYVHINAADLISGVSRGSALYHVVANFAYNNDLVFRGDPLGVSKAAIYRRTENMLSSALKFGTTRHLEPHPDQKVSWKKGDDGFNIAELAKTSARNINEAFPEIADVEYNFEKQRFEIPASLDAGRREADVYDRVRFEDTARASRGARTARAGGRTLARAALINTLLRRKGQEGWDGVLAQISGQRGAGGLAEALKDIFYSKAGRRGAGQTVAQLRRNLSRRLGSRAIEGLERAGFSIIEREDQLPDEVRPQSGEAVRGVYWKGKSYLVARNIPEGTELGVLLHEVGVHAGLKGLLGKALYSEVIQSVETASGNSPLARAVKAARARVPNDTRAAHVTEEILAYVVEDAANRGLPLVRRVLGAIRAWLLRHGFQLKEIRPEDLVALARASVFAVSREATVQRATANVYQAELKKFMDSDKRNAWLTFPSMKVYVRKAKRRIGEKSPLVDTLDLASVEVDGDQRGKGIFNEFIDVFEQVAHNAGLGVFVEEIQQPQFAEFFRKRGGYEVSGPGEGLDGTSLEGIRAALYAFKPFDATSPAYAAEAPTFYSEMAQFIDGKAPGRAPAAQWKNLLDAWAKAGKFKADELAWSGLPEYLDLSQGLVTKDQVLGFVRENGVRVEETVLAGLSPEEIEDLTRLENIAASAETLSQDERRRWEELDKKQYEDLERPQFGQWQLPGGENYRELLLRLPERTSPEVRRLVEIGNRLDEIASLPATETDTKTARGKEYQREHDRLTTERRELQAKAPAKTEFKSGHFDQPNILAHVRFNERTDADGKRVLFIEEIQSDWAQKGKREGFDSGADKNEPAPGHTLDQVPAGWQARNPEGRITGVFGTRQAAIDDTHRNAGVVPRAPFVGKTEAWVGLALKRMIRYAAENGFDRVAWATGEQQAERYDLSKQVQHIAWEKNDDGTYNINAPLPDGKPGLYKEDVEAKELPDLIGKEVAGKIASGEGRQDKESQLRDWRILEGADLKVGGHGMRAFYDRIVPNTANALLKKLGGGRVGTVSIDRTGKDDLIPVSGEQPGFDLTPALRESVLRGLPLFSRQADIARGQAAMDRVIRIRGDEMEAMERGGLGKIAFLWGNAGRLDARKGRYVEGGGVAHIIAQRDLEGKDGEATARAMPEVIALGDVGPVYGPPGGERVNVHHQGKTAVLSLYHFGQERTWLLTGWEEGPGGVEGVNPNDTYAPSPSGIQAEEGAGPESTIEPGGGPVKGPQAPMYSRAAAATLPGLLDNGNVPRVREWFAPKLDAARVKLQDRFLMLKRHQEAVAARSGPIPEQADAYLAQTLYHGRADARLKDLKAAHIDSLIEAIHRSGANLDQVEDFLYALHAPSRNRVLAGRNPRFDPRSEKYGGSPGSGMTDEESSAILKSARDAGLYDALDAISRQVQALNEAVLQGRIADGLMSEEDADGWRRQWENYVPLRGVDGKDTFPRLGHGFTIKGAESKQAFGRASKAGDLLAHVVSAAEEAIVRGEKNKVGQAFLTFAEENPSDHWEVKNIQFKPTVDKDTGEMTFERDPFYTLADDVFSVKRDGAQFHVKLGDPALARSLKNLGAEDSNIVVRTVGALTRALSFLSTTANPEFLISNFARDIQEAGINLAGEKGAAMAGRVMKDVPKALRGAYQAIRKGDTTSEWAKYYHGLERSGGLVGYFDSLSVERQAHRLEGMLKDLDPSKPRKAWIALQAVGKFIQESNQVVESGVRLSAYVNARRAGASEAQAAALSKNLTVNFNRRGELGPTMNALYMFFNAGVQGTTRMVQALKHKRTRQIAGGIVGLGVLLEILNQSMSGSGDDEKKYYDKIPEWVKDHNLIMMLPDGKHYMMLPLPYGYNVFHAIGRNFGSLFFGASPLKASQAIVHAGLDAFNPLGGATSIAQFMSPTLTDPIIQQAENLSHFGTPIKPGQSPFGPPRPESSLYWRAVNPAAKEVATWLNEATGGSQVRPGGVDVSPELIEHWAEFVAGGAGRTLMKTLNTGTRLATGQDLPLKEIPFLRRIIGEPDERGDAGVYREAVNEVVRARNEIRYFQQAGDAARVAEVRRDYGAELRLYGLAQATDNRISALRRRSRLMESRGLKTDAIEEQIDSLKMGFTKRYEQATAG